MTECYIFIRCRRKKKRNKNEKKNKQSEALRRRSAMRIWLDDLGFSLWIWLSTHTQSSTIEQKRPLIFIYKIVTMDKCHFNGAYHTDNRKCSAANISYSQRTEILKLILRMYIFLKLLKLILSIRVSRVSYTTCCTRPSPPSPSLPQQQHGKIE